jgi:hypothetical protein
LRHELSRFCLSRKSESAGPLEPDDSFQHRPNRGPVSKRPARSLDVMAVRVSHPPPRPPSVTSHVEQVPARRRQFRHDKELSRSSDRAARPSKTGLVRRYRIYRTIPAKPATILFQSCHAFFNEVLALQSRPARSWHCSIRNIRKAFDPLPSAPLVRFPPASKLD